MPSAFNFDASPFDCLDAEERRLVGESIDIAYFRAGDVVLEVGDVPTHLFVLIKGLVQQIDGSEVVTVYGPDDSFDGRALLSGKASSRFVAAEEVLAYQLAHAAVAELIARNATFGALLFSDLSRKLSALAGRHGRHELQSLAMARVEEAYVRPAHFVDADLDILSVVRLFQAQRTTNVLVKDGERLGIFTATALQRAVLHGTPLDRLPVRELANFALVTVKPTAQLGDALALMIRHKVHRVVVANDDPPRIVGVLEAMDLFSFLANQSYLISLQIASATDLEALGVAARQIANLVGLLHRSGTKVNVIGALVQELNAKLFEGTWKLVAPPELVAASCVFVMGSEGRGEQLLRTDQDNGLLLADGATPPEDLPAICDRFSQALADFGYPPCAGGVMLSRPEWRGSVTEFGDRVCHWLLQPSPAHLMQLAIFLDAHAVCGDAALLAAVRERLFALANDNEPMLGRFAAAVDAFSDTSGWWSRLFAIGGESKDTLDPKRIGIFPIVHGIRALALQSRVRETATVARIEALVAAGRIDRQLGTDLVDSLHFFMRLRLEAGLAEVEHGMPVSGRIDPGRLSSLDRDLLKDTLGVVKRLRQLLHARFHFEAM